MEKKKRFSLVRGVIAIMLLAGAVWVAGRVFGFLGQPEEIELPKASDQHQPTMIVAKSEQGESADASGPEPHSSGDEGHTEKKPQSQDPADNRLSTVKTQGNGKGDGEEQSVSQGADGSQGHTDKGPVAEKGQASGQWPGSGPAISVGTPSNKAIAAFKKQHHDTDKLLYLYTIKTEGDQLMMNYPGKLLVDPDETPLDELKSESHGIPLSIAPQVAHDYLNNQEAMAMAVLDEHKALTAIIATDEAFARLKERQSHFQIANAPAAKAETTHAEKAPEAHGTPAPEPTDKAHAPAAESHQAATTQHAATTTGHGAAEQMQDQTQPAETHDEAASHDAEAAHGTEDADTEGHGEAHGPKLPTDLPLGVVFIDESIKPLQYDPN